MVLDHPGLAAEFVITFTRKYDTPAPKKLRRGFAEGVGLGRAAVLHGRLFAMHK